mgnify:CR=1 FL=1
MPTQRISYVAPETIQDPAILAELDRCRREGTPRPESQAVRAHVPAVFWSFANSWRDVFHKGVCDHSIKELCRVYVSQSVKCEYCGNQRSEKSKNAGLVEEDYKDLLNFEKSTRFNARQKAALAYTAFAFAASDTLLLGRESAGVPDDVHAAADARVLVPMRPGLRSLNVAMAGAMVLGEALRQTKGFP